jgi:hypothetical protein
LPTANGSLQSQSSVVVATSARTSNLLAGSVSTAVSTLVGVSERTVNASGTPTTSSSTATGSSSREIRSGPTLQPNANNSVVGSGDRGSNATGISQVQSSSTTGVIHRQIDVTGIEQVSASTIVGLAEREVNDNTGAVKAGPASTVNGTLVVIGRNAKPNWTTTPSLVFGQAKVEFTARGLVFKPTNNNLLTGAGVRKITSVGTGALQPTTSNLVSGLGEREVETNTITQALSTDSSVVSGLGVRTSNGSGVLEQSTSSAVAGVSEREVEDNTATHALKPTDNNLITAQIFMGRVASGAPTAGTSTVAGTSENAILGSGTLVPTTNNIVVGTAEREVEDNLVTAALRPTTQHIVAGVGQTKRTASGIDMPDDVSKVTGLVEREVTGTGALQGPDNKTRPPLNQAERIMVISGINGFMLSGQSSITATAHVGRNTSADFQPTTDHLVDGVAEREITVDSGINMPDDVSEVTGSAIRLANTSGIEQVDPSVVVGAADRQIDLDSGIAQGDISTVAGIAERQIDLDSGVAQVDTSVVVSTAERIVTGSASLQDGSNVVSGLAEVINTATGTLVDTEATASGTGVRTVHTEPTLVIGGDTSNAPDDADANVEYVAAFGSRNKYYLRITDLGNNNYEGIYNVLSAGQVVFESGSDYNRVPSTSYNTYFKFRGTLIDIVVFNATRIAWYASTLTTAEFLNHSPTIVNGTLNQEIVATSSISKPRGSEFDPIFAPDNLVNGLAERIIVDVETTLDTTPSLVDGTAERKATAQGLIVTDIDVTAVANIGRITNPELATNSSRVTGVSENIIVDDDASPSADISKVAGVAERTIVLEEGIEQVSDLSDVVGLGERTINGVDVTPESQSSTTTGLSERTINYITGAAGTFPGPGSSSATGVAERQIDLISGIEQGDTSDVVGLAERTINGAGVIVDNSNVVNGVSEREMRTSAALRPTTDNLVTGIAERTINLFQSPQAEPSQVNGLSERIINYFDGTAGQFPGPQSSSILGLAERIITLDSGLFSGESDSEQSTIIGLAERTVDLIDGVLSGTSDSEQSTVDGLSERIINLLSGMDMPDDDADVVGVAERIVVLEQGIDMPDDVSKVDGLAERIVVLEQGIVQDSDLEQSHVVGLAERTVVQTGGGVFEPTTNNIVTGVVEREIEINEVTQELKPTDNNLVTGLAERIIVLEDGVLSNRFDSDQSHVVALLDSAPILTIVRKPIEDGVQAQSSEVDTVDADRVVRQIPDGLGPDRLAPSASDANVSYSGDTTLTLSGIVSPVPHNHDYTLLPQGFTVATSGFTDYSVTVDNTYNSYVKHHGPGDYHVVAYSTTANEWVVFESTTNPVLWTGGEVLSGSASNSREVATSSDFRAGPFKILELDEQSRVTGVAEREIEINDITQDLQSGPSTIVGAGFRTAVELDGDVQAQPSETIVGLLGSFAERIIEVDVRGQIDTSVIPDPSTVSGVAERIIEQNEQNANLQGSSSTTGVAERVIGWQRGDLVVPTRSRVVGVAEREIETNGVNQRITNEFNPSRAVGVAERTINLFQGIFSNTSDSEQSHTDNALFPSQGFRTSNLIVGIRSNDSDEQSSTLATTIDGNGERVITSNAIMLETTSSLVTGIAERKIDMSIFGTSDFSIISDQSAVTGVAERIVVNETDHTIVNDLIDAPDQTFTAFYPDHTTTPNSIPGQYFTVDLVGNDLVLSDGASAFDFMDRLFGTYYLTTKTYRLSRDANEYTIDSDYATFQRHNSDGTYDVITRPVSDHPNLGDTWVLLQSADISIYDTPPDTYTTAKSTSYFIGNADATDIQRTVNWTSPTFDIDTSKVEAQSSETTGDAERIITGAGVLVVDDPSVVVGVAEREIEINEITQEIKPTEHNIVTGVAERIITVDEGIHSADDFLEEQSKVEAIVYTNNLEQSRIHTKRKFVLREERKKMFIVRQTPTG